MSENLSIIAFPVLPDSPLTRVVAAAGMVRVQVIDLEQDYAPRDREFWNETLESLLVLRRTLKNVQFEELDADARNTLYLVKEKIDSISISITAYLPHCRSFARTLLVERHLLLKSLVELVEFVQKFVDQVDLAQEEEGGEL